MHKCALRTHCADLGRRILQFGYRFVWRRSDNKVVECNGKATRNVHEYLFGYACLDLLICSCVWMNGYSLFCFVFVLFYLLFVFFFFFFVYDY